MKIFNLVDGIQPLLCFSSLVVGLGAGVVIGTIVMVAGPVSNIVVPNNIVESSLPARISVQVILAPKSVGFKSQTTSSCTERDSDAPAICTDTRVAASTIVAKEEKKLIIHIQ